MYVIVGLTVRLILMLELQRGPAPPNAAFRRGVNRAVLRGNAEPHRGRRHAPPRVAVAVKAS